ncbi:diguanylate cyclase [Candidatus Methylospira mobilis]|uniref:Diguanylate cyclase n=1 Tax=Candidatus Methylospira mobilis TaxID=1808979 RepID=A0A5Q0BPL5_9GAMM|nr:ABC transporter substrate-binding protein [Candidatus Methylospira mobilis]QFY44028.1 diguanylate cyclase [Candidatus Methylospira mobilis]WNV05033.1 ABC transporter substrate-binding protein [Candidatus Methylospira mobilis]
MIVVLLAAHSLALAETALDKVSLQLKWSHQFQFAGYYAAAEKGFYREAGLDVEIREAQSSDEPIQNVLSGKADFGVGTTDLLLLRGQGKPVVALAVIFQHSPLALLTRKDSGIDNLHELSGRKLMIESHSAELIAYLQSEGLGFGKYLVAPHSFDIDDLLHGKADAMSVYVTDEPFSLKKAGVAYNLFSPRAAGIDFYGDNLFTTEAQIQNHPERVKAFRAASLKGWEYAMQHPEEIVQLIYSGYGQKHSIDHLRFEAEKMIPLLPELVEIGHMNPGRWRRIAEVCAEQGMMRPDFDFKGFLYDPNQPPDFTWLYATLGGVLVFALMAGGVAFYIFRLNRHLHISEEHYRLLAENTHDVIWILDIKALHFTYVSPSITRLRGYGVEEALRQTIAASFTAKSAKQVDLALAYLWRYGEVMQHSMELEQPCKDGSIIWVDATVSVMRDAKRRPIGLLGITRDITERKRVAEELRRSEILLRTLYDSTSDAVMLLDENGFFKCNKATLTMFGGTELEYFYSKQLADLSSPEQPCGTDSGILANQHIAAAMKNGSVRFEWMHKRVDSDKTFPAEVLLNAMELDGKAVVQAVVRDIAERKQSEEIIRKLAFYDALTQLPNRRLLYDRLSHALSLSKRSGRYGALLFLDLDNFKTLNDRCGHAAGDRLLVEAAHRLSSCVRAIDTVARYGGDEFVVILTELLEYREDSSTQAGMVAEKIRAMLAEPFVLNVEWEDRITSALEHYCSASIGVAMFNDQDIDLDSIINRADRAMYQAKAAGRNMIRFYSA